MTIADLIILSIGLIGALISSISSFRYVRDAVSRSRALTQCLAWAVILVVIAVIVPVGVLPGGLATGIMLGSLIGLTTAKRSSPSQIPLLASVPPVIASIIAEKQCPMCAELVKLDAVVCKHCRHQFNKEEVEQAKHQKAEEERKRASAAIEEDRKRAVLERQMASAALQALRNKKARSRRIIAWALIGASCLLFLSWVGGVADLAKGWPASRFIGALLSALVILVALPVIPALLLLRSAKRLSHSDLTQPNAEPFTGANRGPQERLG